MTLSIGFTGTRHGMTSGQWHAVRDLVFELSAGHVFTSHHGDCVGADEQFNEICGSFCARALVTVHPGPVGDLSAGCVGVERRAPAAHMRRNRNIVNEATVVIAAPLEMTRRERGGTWATIGMARKAGKPLAIAWPDGSLTKERWP